MKSQEHGPSQFQDKASEETGLSFSRETQDELVKHFWGAAYNSRKVVDGLIKEIGDIIDKRDEKKQMALQFGIIDISVEVEVLVYKKLCELFNIDKISKDKAYDF